MYKKIIEFEPKEFNMSMIQEHMKIIFIGKTFTGKSTLVLDYLYNHQDIPLMTVVSPTDEFNHTFENHVPSMFIHSEYTPELIQSIVKRQKNITKKIDNDKKYTNVDPRNVLILDDCLADDTWKKDPNIKWLFYNGRHVKITVILTMQFALGLPPQLRSNFQWVFLCRDNRITEQKKMYENFGSVFPSFEMFRQVHDKCTENYGCLVIDLTSTSTRLSDSVFWYKVDINSKPDWSDFKLCDEKYWRKNNEIKNVISKAEENFKNNNEFALTKQIKYNIKTPNKYDDDIETDCDY